MPDFKELAKGGWHPKGKDGNSESWRGDFKGLNQVAGWVGKGKEPTVPAAERTSRPLSTLKDPASFGPPPKHINYHGGAALPTQTTPDTSGLGAPLTQGEIPAQGVAQEEQRRKKEEIERKPKPPPVPFRIDTTGLSTSHLPPPPKRKDGADGRSPLPPTPKPKPPGLPPRLPPRQSSPPDSSSNTVVASEPDSHKGILNEGSLSRLGAAGVSVPGFGIRTTPSSASPDQSHRTANSTSQLNELQSRFSQLSSSTSPEPGNPNEGITLAQKQAALQTASSFRNDPSSISLSDARDAAGTTNDFRERHGDQIRSGWQAANKFNIKYGIADKIRSSGDVGHSQPSETANHRIEMRDNTIGEQSSSMGRKNPPPPPVKKASLVAPVQLKESTAPPVPLSSKPKPQTVIPEAQDLDLDLNSLWFSKSPPTFPPATINRLPGSRSYTSSSGWSSSGVRKIYSFTGAIRDNSTLATTIIHLTWDGSNPGLTVKAQQRHVPPPRKLSRSELDSYRDEYSDAIADWSESKMRQQVGDGECWTLANEALLAVGAKASSQGREPCMSSQSYVHGFLIYSYIPATSPYPEPRGGIQEAGVARGDILQHLSTHFKAKDGRSEKWAGAPDHTAVVVGVEPDGVLRVVEQNIGGVKIVREGSYDMSELVRGEVRIFRAVGESWVGKLDAKW